MKNITLYIFLVFAFFNNAYGQEILFDFSNDMQGWTAYDLDGNGNTIMQGKQWYVDVNDLKGKETSEGVLRYNIANFDGIYVPGYDKEDNWVISPPINISKLGSALDLELVWETTDPRTNRAFVVFFASSSPDVETFRNLTTKQSIGNVQRATTNSSFPDFQSKTITIQKTKLPASDVIYLGIKRSSMPAEHSTNINIKEINMVPNGGGEISLSTTEVKASKNITKLAQNPVSTALLLKLNPAMAAAKTTMQVYSVTGQQVLNTKYSREISVAQLAPGMYFARVSDGTLTETVKFIKK
ncbi:T9SS type A sorting domain-containing protein [Chryseobacterium taklimakanense]|uniref:T9SS C-terminal target domain-containing protein n=1 Tax=Chryseobacterium taklimakanense TaxID=536441 RepID=A0A3G8WY31_9FLAO|nr:T9SS type A sorting domain-containing protein [Chryseobacterium taklimakanense]AZI20676.1 T9SS C-terminal target domain-containing protein [Chryseobacterium taklimakanense]